LPAADARQRFAKILGDLAGEDDPNVFPVGGKWSSIPF
jgi:hypothetical protein